MTDLLTTAEQEKLIEKANRRVWNTNLMITFLTRAQIEVYFRKSFQVRDMLVSAAFCFKQIDLICINLDVFSGLGEVSRLFVLEHELAHLMHQNITEEHLIDSIALENMLCSGEAVHQIEMEKILSHESLFTKSQRLFNFKHHIESHGKSKHETHC